VRHLLGIMDASPQGRYISLSVCRQRAASPSNFKWLFFASLFGMKQNCMEQLGYALKSVPNNTFHHNEIKYKQNDGIKTFLEMAPNYIEYLSIGK
jgi:hypothetical protein